MEAGTEQSTPTLVNGSVVAGRYEVTGRLGEGGLGEVYKCIVLATGGWAALKILKPVHNSNTNAVERFLQEPRAAAAVNHKRIIKVSDAGADEKAGVYFLVMELLDGHDLGKEINRFGGKLPIEHAINVILQVCDGLAAAHAAGVIHRDLKPENIFVTRTQGNLGTEFEVKILDFGIARVDGVERMTQTSTVIGTPCYMSVEQQLRPKTIGPQTDIYALGVMMYEMVTGRMPFEGETPAAVFSAQLDDKVAPMNGIDVDFEAIVLKAMAKDVANRCQSVSELAEALKTYTRNSSNGTAAPRPSTLPPEPTSTGNNNPTPLAIEILEAPVRAPTHMGPFVSESREDPSRRRQPLLRGLAALGAATILVGGLALAFGGHKAPPTRVVTNNITTATPPVTHITPAANTPPATTDANTVHPVARAETPAPTPTTDPPVEPVAEAEPPAQTSVEPLPTPAEEHHHGHRDRSALREQRNGHAPIASAPHCRDNRYTYSTASHQCCRTLRSGAIDCDGEVAP